MSEQAKQLELPGLKKLVKNTQNAWVDYIEVLPSGRKRVHRVKRPSDKK